jgi:hypothetical protein
LHMLRILDLSLLLLLLLFYFLCSPTRAMASLSTRFLDHTQRRATVDRVSLDEWSGRRRNLYLTTHNRQTSTPRCDSNPRSQWASGHRPTPWSATIRL